MQIAHHLSKLWKNKKGSFFMKHHVCRWYTAGTMCAMPNTHHMMKWFSSHDRQEKEPSNVLFQSQFCTLSVNIAAAAGYATATPSRRHSNSPAQLLPLSSHTLDGFPGTTVLLRCLLDCWGSGRAGETRTIHIFPIKTLTLHHIHT